MPKPAIDASNLIRIDTYAAELEWLHLWGTDEEIDREFKFGLSNDLGIHAG